MILTTFIVFSFVISKIKLRLFNLSLRGMRSFLLIESILKTPRSSSDGKWHKESLSNFLCKG